jgi:hypothetical protein
VNVDGHDVKRLGGRELELAAFEKLAGWAQLASAEPWEIVVSVG